MAEYNATIYATRDGEPYYTGVCEAAMINGRLQMLRGNGVTCTGYEGKTGTLKATGEDIALYDYYRRQCEPGVEFEIVLDNCKGFQDKINAMGFPPSYKT